MNADRIVEPFPVKDNLSKSNMASSSTSTGSAASAKDSQHMCFDPKFKNLPASTSDDWYDSGLASFGSEYCPSGGLENIQDAFQKLRLGGTLEQQTASAEQQPKQREQEKEELEEIEDIEDEESEEEVQLTADAFDQDQEGDTPLHLAIIHEDDIALQFIRFAPTEHHLNIANHLYQTPLHLSVHTKQHTVCRALVVAGVPMETVDRDGNTALHLACRQGNSECAKILTSKVTAQELEQQNRHNKAIHIQQLPQNLELRNFDGLTCLHLAAQAQNFHLVCYLRSIGGQIDAPDGKSGRTALHHAVETNNFNLVQYLISLGADVNALTFDQCSPLHLAIGRGLQRIILLLLEHGADINVFNSEGLTPADLATNQHQLMFLHQQPEYNDFQLQGL
ncbi:NF-kappa-B inhibitor epsilon-like [Amphiura filiformis]|uniref:NF-kappa-B inhibitor epsilon-like n=1 Tax=Amphiura filiformis TaxID=82378 RepID=UPI003B2101A8